VNFPKGKVGTVGLGAVGTLRNEKGGEVEVDDSPRKQILGGFTRKTREKKKNQIIRRE